MVPGPAAMGKAVLTRAALVPMAAPAVPGPAAMGRAVLTRAAFVPVGSAAVETGLAAMAGLAAVFVPAAPAVGPVWAVSVAPTVCRLLPWRIIRDRSNGLLKVKNRFTSGSRKWRRNSFRLRRRLPR
ncbi:hypothetical protein AGMMS4952_15710 [Spirochaetia bacterium]|nr:hypothetical protein AGMMS4952_15710 [Spirochaetia bacterium]